MFFKKKSFISKIVLASILLISVNNSSFAFEESDYNFLTPSYNPAVEFRENYLKLKSILETVEEKIKYQEKIKKNTNYKIASKLFEEAKNALMSSDTAYTLGEFDTSKKLFDTAILKIKESQLNLMPSRVVEARGMLIDADSIPKTKKEITELIQKIKNANFNIIYPEVTRRGYAIFSNNITELDPSFKNLDFDPLAYLIEEAHENNLEVHPWVWVFRVKSPTYGDPILSRYSNLTAIKENPLPTDREPLFLSPSAPQARELVAKMMKFIASNYNIDGLLLDYIRYDEIFNEDFLSKKYFRLHFLEKYGKEPDWNLSKNDPIFAEWQLWRESQVTQAVELIKEEVNSVKPNLPIGASVFRTEGEGRLIKMQDWRLWDSNLLIKYVSPMLYTDNASDLYTWLESETDKNTRNDYLYVTLGANKFTKPESIYSQVGVLADRYITGLNIFALAHYKHENFRDISKSIFRKTAFIPHKNPSKAIRLIISDTIAWLKNVLKETPKDDQEKIQKLITKISSLLKFFPDNYSKLDYNKAQNSLKETISFISKDYDPYNQFYSKFLEEINDNLEYSLKILKIYSREKASEGKKFLPSMPPIPVLEETKKLPYTNVYKTEVPVIIDGLSIFSVWEKTEPLRHFYWHLGFARSQADTSVKITYDDENLYILFENFESDFSKTKASKLERDDFKIFSEDSVEVILQVPSRSKYYRFVLNKKNSQLDEDSGNIKWSPEWSSAVKIEDNKWVAEIMIPFEFINFKPSKGMALKANFIRNRPQELNPNSHWSPTYGGPTNLSRFGTLVFK